MANINGSNHNDNIVGTIVADNINGRNGDDFIDGGQGDDILIGGRGHDVFVLREGGGHDIVTDFKVGEDRVLFDFGSYSDALKLGAYVDGESITTALGDVFVITAIDTNGDLVKDSTLIVVNGDDSIQLTGVMPPEMHGMDLFGG